MLNLTTMMNSDKTGTVWEPGTLGRDACLFLGWIWRVLWFLCIALALGVDLVCVWVYIGVEALNGTRFTSFAVSLVLFSHTHGVDARSRCIGPKALLSIVRISPKLSEKGHS